MDNMTAEQRERERVNATPAVMINRFVVDGNEEIARIAFVEIIGGEHYCRGVIALPADSALKLAALLYTLFGPANTTDKKEKLQ